MELKTDKTETKPDFVQSKRKPMKEQPNVDRAEALMEKRIVKPGCCIGRYCQTFCGCQTIEDESHPPQFEHKKVDMSTHIGLRGLLVILIVHFHMFHYGELKWDAGGSAHMSFFFLLSGFTLAVIYGKTTWDPMPCCVELRTDREVHTPEGEVLNLMNARSFYQNRFARLIPTYYLISIFGAIIFANNQGLVEPTFFWTIYTFITNIFCVQMWFGISPISFVGPAWTLSTLVFFYYVFPSQLPFLQRLTHKQLVSRIWILFWLQLFVCAFLCFIPIFFGMEFQAWLGTGWPPSRLPIFEMGICAGLCVSRGWNPFIAPAASEDHTQLDAYHWGRKVDIWFNVYMIITVTGFVLSAVLDITIYWGLIGQTFFVYAQLIIIVGICLDEGTSCTSKFLNWRIWHWFGEFSMTLYLLHEPCIYCFHWAWGYDKVWRDDTVIPWQGMLIVPAISIPVAWILKHYWGDPLRNYFRAPKKIKPTMDSKTEKDVEQPNNQN